MSQTSGEIMRYLTERREDSGELPANLRLKQASSKILDGPARVGAQAAKQVTEPVLIQNIDDNNDMVWEGCPNCD
jgi:hypothetical protein